MKSLLFFINIKTIYNCRMILIHKKKYKESLLKTINLFKIKLSNKQTISNNLRKIITLS